MELSDWIGLAGFAIGYFSAAILAIEVLHLRPWVVMTANIIGGTVLGVAAHYIAMWPSAVLARMPASSQPSA
jgi:hypothetical protein